MPETALAFLLAFVVGLGLSLFVKPIYGLYTYVAVFYLHPPSRWWGEMLPDIRWSLVAAIITLLSVFVHRKALGTRDDWLSNPISRILVLYTVWMWVQWPWVISPWHQDGAILFAKYILLVYLIVATISDESELRGFCFAHTIGCAYLAVLVYLAPDSGRLEGVGGPGIDDANTLGMHLATGLMFAAFLLLSSKGKTKWLILAMLPLILNGIIQTETRGALVGVFLGGVATIVLKPRKFRRAFYSWTIVGLIGLVTLGNEAFVARMSTMTAAVDDDQEWDSSAESRVEIVKSQFEMFKDYPFGVGHQGTAYLSPKYMEEKWLASNSGNRASHNTVMSVLVDQGIFGLLLLFALMIAVLRELKRLKRLDSSGLSDELAIYRTMIGGAIVTIFGAGMFAQNLKAEVQIWSLSLLIVVSYFAKKSVQAGGNGPNNTVAMQKDCTIAS